MCANTLCAPYISALRGGSILDAARRIFSRAAHVQPRQWIE
jgi:hypothetical protein